MLLPPSKDSHTEPAGSETDRCDDDDVDEDDDGDVCVASRMDVGLTRISNVQVQCKMFWGAERRVVQKRNKIILEK